jgi:peptidoglycan-associated lipoprotein
MYLNLKDDIDPVFGCRLGWLGSFGPFEKEDGMQGVIFKGILLVFISAGLIFTLSCRGGSVKTDSPPAAASENEISDQTPETEPEPLVASAEGELPEGWDILESEDIFFDKKSYSLLPEAQELLKKKAEWLLQNPDINVVIKGYSDEPGTNEYNIALGDRRAGSVKSFLIKMGIDPSRLAAVSYGREGLAETGSDEASKAENRRVHIVIDVID